MTHTHRVIKNSFWIVLQTLVLNILSVFVIGYIARSLGNENFGVFNFAFSFVAIFMPFVNFGLGSLATREIAEHPESASSYLSKLLCLRMCISLVVYITVIISIMLIGYPIEMKITIAIAALNVIFNSFTASFNSAFQGIEKMEYMAFIQFISGLTLTVFSLIVLWFGFRLYGLTVVYVSGSLLSSAISFFYIKQLIGINGFTFDIKFMTKSLTSGFPLFLPGFIMGLSSKFGIVVLEKVSGASAVGIFSAASGLTEKLSVIPDGICTAIFPSIAALYISSRQDAESLYRKFFTYLFIIGLPIAVGIQLVAKPVIDLVYGPKFYGAELPLQLLGWSLFISFMTSIQGWTLGATHKEKIVAKISIIMGCISIIVNLILIPLLGTIGLPISMILFNIINFFLMRNVLKKHFMEYHSNPICFLKIVLTNLIMFICVFPFKSNLLIAIPLAMLVYVILLLVLDVIRKDDFQKVKNILIAKTNYLS